MDDSEGPDPAVDAIKLLNDRGYFVTKRENRYDRKDMVKRCGMLRAGALLIAGYKVRDPETDAWSKLQIHMTYDNTVMAVMEEESAKLFTRFVQDNIMPTEAELKAARIKAAKDLRDWFRAGDDPHAKTLAEMLDASLQKTGVL
jgi:hypothetical protein